MSGPIGREQPGFRWSRSLPAALIVGTWLGVLGVPSFAVAAETAKGSSGSIRLSGEVVAVLKVPAFLQPGNQPGCTISPSQGGTDVIVWDNVKIKEAGKTDTVANMNLQLEVPKFGHTYSMTVSKATGSASAAAYLTTADPFQWTSESGNITTSAGGKSGSIDGVLSAGTRHPGKITIKGSWGGCGLL
jgi:hypothetical protein